MELVYIAHDGTERMVGDVPALAACVRDGEIVDSTLVRDHSGVPWRQAKEHPDIAALLALANVKAEASPRAVKVPGRRTSIWKRWTRLTLRAVIATFFVRVWGPLVAIVLVSLGLLIWNAIPKRADFSASEQPTTAAPQPAPPNGLLTDEQRRALAQKPDDWVLPGRQTQPNDWIVPK